MPAFSALSRSIGATALALALAAAAVLPAASLAAPPEGVTISPSPGTFPLTTVGDSSPAQEFEIANGGAEAPSIETIVVEGPDFGGFRTQPVQLRRTFLSRHCAFFVTFAPSDAGEKQATVSVQFGGGSELTLALSGTAVAPQLAFAPGSYDYGVQPPDSEQETGFQVTNTGEASVRVENPEIVGPGFSAFFIGSSDCSGRLLNPSESCSLQVHFSPHDPVAYSAQARVSANGVFFTADLTGVGGQSIVEGSPNPADFGAATVGGTGALRTITLTNSGNIAAPAYFTGAISGGDAGSFRLLDESCTAAALEPAASCTAHVASSRSAPAPRPRSCPSSATRTAVPRSR